MRRSFGFIPLALLACGGERNPENSVVCGVSLVAAAGIVLEQFQGGATLLSSPPADLLGDVPARVVGHGTGRALAARADSAAVLGFEGEGFPQRPGFAVALVDDSSEVFRGVLVFETDGPADYPQIGTMSTSTSTLPLYGMRITWGRVSDRRCPLFALRDTTPR